ncbi:PadR family transcriptional regulator [Halospeciosus flavus]|uniref:PadR family transcriptional regulator n=1 Tax=Halospeciosus flavus TaxID=3032283 RepID=UPI0036198784
MRGSTVVNNKLLPLALLYVDRGREIEGITRLQKLVFLAQKDEGVSGDDGFEFKPYKYGPYSKELMDVLDTLEDRGYIKKTIQTTRSGNEKYIYSLTEDGQELVRKGLLKKRGGKDLLDKSEDVKKKYNQQPIERVLRYVYNKYPEYAKNSELDIAN